jgi:hypothetical protein
VAATLPAARPELLAAALAACASDPAAYEASVRGGTGAALGAGRMMIEQASGDLLDAVAGALGVRLPRTAAQWLAAARSEKVPLIVGWDLRGGGEGRCAKLYVNASDASRAARARLRRALLPALAGLEDAPAVLGMNVGAGGMVEIKVYTQSPDARALAAGRGEAAELLAAAAGAEGADAGGVLSHDVEGGTLRARAFFVALREPPNADGWRCVGSLPGYEPRRIESLLPFRPAPPRSVGVSLSSSSSPLAPRPSPLAWTLYFKPRDSGAAPEALEPVAIFRAGGVEVGVFVEPTERAARAFRRTERHAVSVRVRDGKPAAGALEPLVDWFAARLSASEQNGRALAPRLSDPPAPWRIVDPAGPPA